MRRVLFITVQVFLLLAGTLALFSKTVEAERQIEYTGFVEIYTDTVRAESQVTMTITYNDDDDTVQGHFHATGGAPICADQDFSGTKHGNNITFTLVNGGCDINMTMWQYGKLLSGSYTTTDGHEGVIRLISHSGWVDVEHLKAEYESKRDAASPDAAFAFQFWCIADKTQDEFLTNGDNGWASEGGFVKYVFDDMIGADGLTGSVRHVCKNSKNPDVCFGQAGNIHQGELHRGYMRYCLDNKEIDYQRWDSDHNLFLNKGVYACFEEMRAEQGNINLSDGAIDYLQISVIGVAVELRENVQDYCQNQLDDPPTTPTPVPPPASTPEVTSTLTSTSTSNRSLQIWVASPTQ